MPDDMKKNRDRLQIPGDWIGRDQHLHKLARATGFLTVNRLMSHIAYEISHCKCPATFYRAMARVSEISQRSKRDRSRRHF
jgi:hypothetical protein